MNANQQPLSARMREAFNQAPHEPQSAASVAALRARLQSEAQAVVTTTGTAATSRRISVWALVASLFIIVGLGGGIQAWRTLSRLNELSALAAGDHQNCAIKFALEEKPITLAEAAVRYDPAFGRLQDVSPSASALAASPVRVLERHACVFRGRPFAHIVLNYKDTAVSVLVADDGAVGSEWWRGVAAREMPAAGGYQMASFRSHAHVVFVVSALPAADVTAVAASVMAPISAALAGA